MNGRVANPNIISFMVFVRNRALNTLGGAFQHVSIDASSKRHSLCKNRFPHAVLELAHSTCAMTEPQSWMVEVVASPDLN